MKIKINKISRYSYKIGKTSDLNSENFYSFDVLIFTDLHFLSEFIGISNI